MEYLGIELKYYTANSFPIEASPQTPVLDLQSKTLPTLMISTVRLKGRDIFLLSLEMAASQAHASIIQRKSE